VDDAPWGFAVSHYGRWANLGGSWVWVPGPVRVPAVYAPALVAFVGGSNLQVSISSGPIGAVAWFPLAPREVYRPLYAASRDYYERINRSNTVVNRTVIHNTYNTTNVTNIVYGNRTVPGAVVAVPTTTFVQSQPVSRAAVQVTSEALACAPVSGITHVEPTEQSVRGAATRGDRPPARVFERPVIAHTTPPAPSSAAAVRPPAPSTVPGRPGEQAQRQDEKPAAAAAPRSVSVVEQAQAVRPTRPPPPPDTAAAQPPEPRGEAKDRRFGTVPKGPTAEPSTAPGPVPPQTAPPVVATPTPESPAKAATASTAERRLKAPERTADPAPQATAAPDAQRHEPRGKPGSQGEAAPRNPEVAVPAPVPPAKSVVPLAPAPAAPTQAAPPRPSPSNVHSAEPTPPTASHAAPVPPRGRPTPQQTATPMEPRATVAASSAPTATNRRVPPPAAAEPQATSGGRPNDKDSRDADPKPDKNRGKPKE
jgi:hypothetical protein